MAEKYLGENTGKLGFGLMRLPQKDGVIDVEQTKEMVDLFMAAGFTYFDTAWVYEGSEEAMRKALVERYPRESYTAATKLAAWIKAKTKEEAEAQFDISLERTGLEYFDYYLLHNLGVHRTQVFENFDIWNFVLKKKEEGKIRHIGFSFHSTAEELEKILKKHPEAEFVQLQINYADWEDPAVQSRKIYETARKYNKPVVIMEPVKGGLLAAPPESVAKILKEADPEASLPSWGIRFAASLEGVITVLSGMSNVEQMKDNLSYMKDFKPLSPEEQAVMEKARAELAKIPLIPCTTCNYCSKVCPMDIGISGTFKSLNMLTLFGNEQEALKQEGFDVIGAGKKRAIECVGCGACEEACPQKIAIRENLEKAKEAFHMQ